MQTVKAHSTALPLAHLTLRILIVLNWLGGVGIAILLIGMPTSAWIRSALKIPPFADARALIIGLHAIAVLGLLAIPVNYIVLKKLLAMVETVRAGDPFVITNAERLQSIACGLLALQLLSIVIGGIAESISSSAHPLDFDAGFSVTGWLAVLLTFLLARVFREGARMRDDLEGTV